MTQETVIQDKGGETEDSREPKTLDVPQIVVIDFDRTLAMVEGPNGTFANFIAFAREAGVDTEAMQKDRQDIEAAGESFSPITYIENNYSPEVAMRILETMQLKINPRQLFNDAPNFLARLAERNIPHFVMTYATHKKGQRAKVESTGLTTDYLITEEKNKDIVRKSITSKDGKMHLQMSKEPWVSYESENVCLIDDKLPTCKEWGGPAFWLNRDDRTPQDELPHNVTMIRSLDELVVIDGVLQARKT